MQIINSDYINSKYIEEPFFHWSTYDELKSFIEKFQHINEEQKVYIILKKFLRTDFAFDIFHQYLPMENLRPDAIILFFNVYPKYFDKTVSEFFNLNKNKITDQNVKRAYDILFEEINLSINIQQF